MTTADVEKIIEVAQRRPQSTQATAIEQSRAIAEVQAAVVVAQQVPRDMGAAWENMRDACRRSGLANRAFYSVTNRGTGPTVHLARELARIFGNMQHGVAELRRDDEQGMSEVQAFAWDVEKNSRTTRTFQVPHQRMKRINGVNTRDPLVDLTDIYLNNQNIGARAVRECIFAVLPADFVDAAQQLCHETLIKGEGKPLPDRIADMVTGFAGIGVTGDQLEDKIGRKRSAWQPVDLAQMSIVYQSIQRGELTKEDAFPARRITAAEVMSDEQKPAGDIRSNNIPADVTVDPAMDLEDRSREQNIQTSPASTASPGEAVPAGSPSPAAGRAPGDPCTVSQQAVIRGHFARLGIRDDQERTFWMNRLAGLAENTVSVPKELRAAEAEKLLDALAKIADTDELDASLAQGRLIGDDDGPAG